MFSCEEMIFIEESNPIHFEHIFVYSCDVIQIDMFNQLELRY